jgi:hypothetical protein
MWVAKNCSSMGSLDFIILKKLRAGKIMNSEFVAYQCRSIVPYIKKFGKHPVTGAPLKQEDLIPLTFHKNSDGELS